MMPIKKPLFVEDIVPANRADKTLTENFITGLPSWITQNDFQGSNNSMNYKDPTNSDGNGIELVTGTTSGDGVAAQSDFNIKLEYWDRVILKGKDIKLSSWDEAVFMFGLYNSTGDSKININGYTGSAMSDYLRLSLRAEDSTDSNDIDIATTTDVPDLTNPLDMLIDINLVEEKVTAEVEHSKVKYSGSTYLPDNSNDTCYLIMPYVKTKDTSAKKISMSKFSLRMWQQQ